MFCACAPSITAPLVPSINSDVFCIAATGAVGGVNAPVYTAVPFTNLTFEMYPGKYVLA
jgi:hypothetical protein